jgi:MoaA/NifB/PqqE/SkfB family radical SAM enzyme
MPNPLRITTENRTKLEDVIPLPTPFLVFIDPSNVCNQQCEFCPTGNRELIKQIGREKVVMTWDLYKKTIDQLCGFPGVIKTLRLYKDGEPLMNPMLPEMIMYASDKMKFGQIDTTTNGRLLSTLINRELISAGLTKIFISVPRDYDGQYIYNISDFFYRSRGKCQVFVKIAGDYLSYKEINEFNFSFKTISDSCAIEHTAPCWPGFNVKGINKDVGIYGQPVQDDIKVCPYIFYSITINSNGKVGHCFVDWKQSVVLGDLCEDNIVDIWNGKELRDIRIAHLKGLRNMLPHCEECEHHRYGMPDNIDQHADELLKRIES